MPDIQFSYTPPEQKFSRATMRGLSSRDDVIRAMTARNHSVGEIAFAQAVGFFHSMQSPSAEQKAWVVEVIKQTACSNWILRESLIEIGFNVDASSLDNILKHISMAINYPGLALLDPVDILERVRAWIDGERVKARLFAAEMKQEQIQSKAIQTNPLTEKQRKVLEALAGRAMTLKELGVELECDPSRLYRDHLKGLLADGSIRNDRAIGGYYRLDSPPPHDGVTMA